MLHRLLAATTLAALLPLATHAAPASPWQGKLHPCTLPDGGGKAFCGTYDVFENREARSGRKIALKIVVLPAKGRDRAPDPVFLLEGGPGEGAATDAGELALAPVRVRRDIVFVDVRGTGGSNPLPARSGATARGSITFFLSTPSSPAATRCRSGPTSPSTPRRPPWTTSTRCDAISGTVR